MLGQGERLVASRILGASRFAGDMAEWSAKSGRCSTPDDAVQVCRSLTVLGGGHPRSLAGPLRTRCRIYRSTARTTSALILRVASVSHTAQCHVCETEAQAISARNRRICRNAASRTPDTTQIAREGLQLMKARAGRQTVGHVHNCPHFATALSKRRYIPLSLREP